MSSEHVDYREAYENSDAANRDLREQLAAAKADAERLRGALFAYHCFNRINQDLQAFQYETAEAALKGTTVVAETSSVHPEDVREFEEHVARYRKRWEEQIQAGKEGL